MSGKFCTCKRCKKAKRKGLILGTRWEFSWKNGGLCRVSDYVPFVHYLKGRRPQPNFDRRNPLKDY